MLLPFARHTFLESSLAEGVMLIASFMVAAISLRLSYLKHRQRRVLVVMLVGFCLLISGVMAAPTAALELLMTSSGGGLIALGHYLNWRYTRGSRKIQLLNRAGA